MKSSLQGDLRQSSTGMCRHCLGGRYCLSWLNSPGLDDLAGLAWAGSQLLGQLHLASGVDSEGSAHLGLRIPRNPKSGKKSECTSTI